MKFGTNGILGLCVVAAQLAGCGAPPWMPVKGMSDPTGTSAVDVAADQPLDASTGDYVERLAQDLVADPEQPELREARAELLIDALLVYEALEANGAVMALSSDEVAEWVITLVPSAADAGVAAAYRVALEDAAAVGWSDDRIAAINAWSEPPTRLWDAGMWTDTDQWIRDRTLVAGWFAMAPSVRQWIADPTTVDRLASDCGAFCDSGQTLESPEPCDPDTPETCIDGPIPGLSAELTSEATLASAQALEGLYARATELAMLPMRERRERPTELLDRLLVSLPEEVRGWGIAAGVPDSVLQTDVRLALPNARLPHGAESRVFEQRLAANMVIVRSDAVAVATLPRLTVDETTGTVSAGTNPHAFPGEELLAFDGPSRLPVGGLDDAALLPSVQDGIVATFEADARVSVLVDRSTYFATLEPVLRTLTESGFDDLVFHATAPDASLVAVPVAIDTTEPTTNLLIVRDDGYIVEPYDEAALATPEVFSRVGTYPLAELYTYLHAAFDDGRLDPAHGLSIRVDDGSTDFGILVHLLTALLYERDGESFETDPELLGAPVNLENGVPVSLIPGGITVRLGAGL